MHTVRNNDAWVDAAFHERMRHISGPTAAIGLRQVAAIDRREFADYLTEATLGTGNFETSSSMKSIKTRILRGAYLRLTYTK